MKEYPQTFFIPFQGISHCLGRLVVYKHHNGFSVEIDIVLTETKKIFKHIGTVHDNIAIEDIIAHATQILRESITK